VNRSFWRPFLILGTAVLLISIVFRLLPDWDNQVFPIKRMDWLEELLRVFFPPEMEEPQTAEEEAPVENETVPLRTFTAKLAQLKAEGQGNIRIAHYGDSIIEGDLITGKLRELLQSEYGGSGVGLVPITSIVSDFRMTIGHRFSRNWESRSFANRGSYDVPLGMIGYTFIPRNYYLAETVIKVEPKIAVPDSLQADSVRVAAPATKAKKETRRIAVAGPAWVEYYGTDNPGGAPQFRRIRLFYSQASAKSRIRAAFDGKPSQTFQLQAEEGIQVLDLSAGGPVNKVRLEFDPRDPIHVYGVSFDDTDGVYVDNHAVRGYTGMYFNALPQEHMAGFQEHLDYDLIMLQYGLNVSQPKARDYDDYKTMMIRSVQHIQAALPDVPILIIGVHDRGIRQAGVFQTSPDIPLLVNTQAEIAAATGCAFWNVYEAMGGLNSMLEYVNAKPPLANTDYTHFNLAGANKIAAMLYETLTGGGAK